MEDTYQAIPKFAEFENSSFYGVYDGHGGLFYFYFFFFLNCVGVLCMSLGWFFFFAKKFLFFFRNAI